MMDRRALLKRLGMAGLAIPIATVVEKNLVLAPDYLPLPPHVAERFENPMVMIFDGWASTMNIELKRFAEPYKSTYDPVKRVALGPLSAVLNLEMLVQDGNITAPQLDIEDGSRVRVKIATWPPAYARYKGAAV